MPGRAGCCNGVEAPFWGLQVIGCVSVGGDAHAAEICFELECVTWAGDDALYV